MWILGLKGLRMVVTMQCCQLSRMIRETPDFRPYLPASRLKYEISRIIAIEVVFYFFSRLDFPTIKFQILVPFERAKFRIYCIV